MGTVLLTHPNKESCMLMGVAMMNIGGMLMSVCELHMNMRM